MIIPIFYQGVGVELVKILNSHGRIIFTSRFSHQRWIFKHQVHGKMLNVGQVLINYFDVQIRLKLGPVDDQVAVMIE